MQYLHIHILFPPPHTHTLHHDRVVKFAVMHLHQDGGPVESIVPRVSLASKHVLQHTRDSDTPNIMVYRDQFGRYNRRAVIMGITYYLDLEWDLPSYLHSTLVELGPMSEGERHIHRLVITKDRTGTFSLFRHTVLIVKHNEELETSTWERNSNHLIYSDQGWILVCLWIKNMVWWKKNMSVH